MKLAKNNLNWPVMTNEIKNKKQNCETCAKYMDSQQVSEMTSHDIPLYPFQYISMDILETEYESKSRKFLVMVDHYSDYFELDLLKNMTAASVIKICKMNFSRHGIPARICTDNGTNFNCQEFKQFCHEWNIELTFSSPHHQKGNGKAE